LKNFIALDVTENILSFILKDCQILFAGYFYSTPLKAVLAHCEGLWLIKY